MRLILNPSSMPCLQGTLKHSVQILGLKLSLSNATCSSPKWCTNASGEKKKALVKASNAQEHSTSQPTAAQRVGQCWNSHPTHHHLLPISPMSSKLQRSRSCKNTHSNLLTPRALEAPQQTGNTGRPETEMPPTLALLGADRIHVVRKGVSQPLHPLSPPVQKQ